MFIAPANRTVLLPVASRPHPISLINFATLGRGFEPLVQIASIRQIPTPLGRIDDNTPTGTEKLGIWLTGEFPGARDGLEVVYLGHAIVRDFGVLGYLWTWIAKSIRSVILTLSQPVADLFRRPGMIDFLGAKGVNGIGGKGATL